LRELEQIINTIIYFLDRGGLKRWNIIILIQCLYH
jgi:hypothetical protein